MLRPVLIGHGAALPERIVTNHDLATRLDTSDEWITTRTGISQRHIAAEGEFTSHLAARAGGAAISFAAISPDTIDLLLLATTTPDETMPSTASRVQALLGLHCPAMDINAACSGFIYALHMANGLIQAGLNKRILVIGAETYSRILDWNDRATCVLFGDGAGAFLLEAQADAPSGVLHTQIYADGRLGDILCTSGGVSTTGTAGTLSMAGKEVFKHAVTHMATAMQEGLAACGLGTAEVDWVIPHQANARIMLAIAQKLDVPEHKLISTVALHANTAAASIPLAFAHAWSKKMLCKGNLLVLPALGAGLAWGCCIIKI